MTGLFIGQRVSVLENSDLISVLALVVGIISAVGGGVWFAIKRNDTRISEHKEANDLAASDKDKANTLRQDQMYREFKEHIKDLGNTFAKSLDDIAKQHREDIKQLSADNRQNDKELSEALHLRISEVNRAQHDFQVRVAENYPQRSEMDTKIADAVKPVIREMQRVHTQMSELTAAVNDSIKERQR